MVKVVVIGAGIIGISSAYLIKEAYSQFDVTVVADKFSPNNTSDGAAGMWYRANEGNTPRELINRWADATRRHALTLLKSPDAPKMGLSIAHGYLVSSRNLESSDWLEQTLDCHVLTADELKGFPSKIKSGCSYNSVFIEPAMFIPYLTKEFMKKGGKVVQQKIEDINSLFHSYDVVVNCSGLGARWLVNDEHVQPMRGQVMRVKAPWIKEIVYHIDADEEGRVAYVFPNQDTIVIGGTKQINDADLQVRSEDRDWILKATQEFIPSLKHAQFVCDWVGLRPARSSIRLETEMVDVGANKKGVIIHNYGHGSSGVTLSWGCGEHVVELLQGCVEGDDLSLHAKL